MSVRENRATSMLITRRCACSNQASLSANGKAARRWSCSCVCSSHPFSHWPTPVASGLLDPFMGNSSGVSEAVRCPSSPGDSPPKILIRSDRLWNKKSPLCPVRFPIAALWSRPPQKSGADQQTGQFQLQGDRERRAERRSFPFPRSTVSDSRDRQTARMPRERAGDSSAP